jgi:hypothetical protein
VTSYGSDFTADHGASKEPLNFSTTSQVEKSYGPAMAADIRFVAADVREGAVTNVALADGGAAGADERIDPGFPGRELIRAKTGSAGTAVRQTPARLSCRRRIDHPGRTGVDRAI